jgi:asparagine synthase (glutamine-hydrolysing)
MCAICGVVALDGPLDPSLAAALVPMRESLRHRGPDDAGVFADDVTALGHRRLSILDLAGGRQPLSNEDGSCWVVFNGEIYNHSALRATLSARGHRFRTSSDTETIVHAYEEYGAGCVEHLHGMFAFAVYDARRRRTLLARDRVGKKPLYYALFGRTLHFASEIKALQRSPAWNGEINLDGLEGYLSLGYSIAPATLFQHVHQLEAGHCIVVENGCVRNRRYWDVEEFDTDDRPEAAVLSELDSRLHEAVRDRLESDVPLGAFLSGGIDSGLIVSHMAESLRRRLVTLSVGFRSQQHDETQAAALTAAHVGTQHHVEYATPVMAEILPALDRSFDEPFADSSAVPTYYVAQLARRHVTVALSGDGADELFGGYGFRYIPHAREERVRRLLPDRIGRRWLARAAGMWPASPSLPRLLRWSATLSNLATDDAGAYYRDLCFLKPAATWRLLGLCGDRELASSSTYAAVTDAYRRCPSSSAVQRAQYADLKIYLPNDVLVKVDRTSMAHGLEVRCPFLDHRIVEMAFRLPTSRKMPRLEPKHLLRRLADRRLPATVSRLPKHGFTAPAGEWIAGAGAGQFEDEVLGSDSWTSAVVDIRHVRALFVQHRQRVRDHTYALWALWTLERWGRAQVASVACERAAS